MYTVSDKDDPVARRHLKNQGTGVINNIVAAAQGAIDPILNDTEDETSI